MSEQSILNEDGSYRFRAKVHSDMKGSILQNPYDSDATFREKAGEQTRRYVANAVEYVGDNGSNIVTSYYFNQNIHNDSDFAKETIEKLGKQDKRVTLAADDACFTAALSKD